MDVYNVREKTAQASCLNGCANLDIVHIQVTESTTAWLWLVYVINDWRENIDYWTVSYKILLKYMWAYRRLNLYIDKPVKTESV